MRQTWFALALVASLIPSVARADEDIDINGVPRAAPTAPLSSWTATQQMRLGEAQRSLMGLLIAADNLGDRLSEIGRAGLISDCFHATDGMVAWAICAQDVKALDMKKLDAELAAGHIGAGSKARFLKAVTEDLAKAKAIGAGFDEAAKTDPGVAQVLKTAETARAEWNAYLAKNKAQYERYLALLDGVRSNKGNHPAFQGCWEATQPAFSKLVKSVAPKVPWDVDTSDGSIPGYLAYLVTSPESYITAASFGACSWSIDDIGGVLFSFAMRAKMLSGPRAITVRKLFDPSFRPKFADRSINYPGTDLPFRGELQVDAASGSAERRSFSHDGGVVGTVKANGDMTKLTFIGERVEMCLQWKEATKTEDKHCVKRGMTPSEVGQLDIHTKFSAGIKKGVNVTVFGGYPVVCWKSKKLTALFTIALP